jgi:hypothetical protein
LIGWGALSEAWFGTPICRRVIHDSANDQKLNGSFLLAMLPHQGNDYLLLIDIFN